MVRDSEQPPEAENGLQPAASKQAGPAAYNHKCINHTNKLGEFGSGFFPWLSLQVRVQPSQQFDYSLGRKT